MGERTEEIRRKLLKCFPKLSSDKAFKLTSAETPIYNCIAWACCYSDRWMQSGQLPLRVDGLEVVRYWPPKAKEGMDIECLKDAFFAEGYESCENGMHEDGYIKVALYAKKETKKWTHAAREKRNGFWTSKMGFGSDIQHGNPYCLEGNIYGEIYCFMKRKWK